MCLHHQPLGMVLYAWGSSAAPVSGHCRVATPPPISPRHTPKDSLCTKTRPPILDLFSEFQFFPDEHSIAFGKSTLQRIYPEQ